MKNVFIQPERDLTKTLKDVCWNAY